MKTTISTASLLLGGVCAIALAAPAFAQAPQIRSFDIPGGELRQALDAYIRQSGAQLIYRTDDVRGTKTRGVAGALPSEEALKRVLAGTPFVVKRDASGAIAIVAAPSDADFRVRPVATTAEAVAGSASAYIAQPVAPSPAPPTVEEVMVTGSRIIRDGYEAPTPTTVIGAADIQARAPANIADYVNQLPAMGVGNSPRTTLMFANATGGANQLSARGLGTTRTLVLLDGRRVVGSGMSPAVDVNLLPQNLVSRVDVVTGGASAAYGSDAVAGVVNFILDSNFTGLKGSVSEGVTQESDGETFSGDLAFGAKFAGNRGHILLSASYFDGHGIDSPLSRSWYKPGYRLLTNPDWTATNGQPGQIVRNDSGYTSTPGGVINSGPLKGTNFLPGGQIGQFVFGPIQQGQMQAGGSIEDTAYQWPLLPDEKHWSTYGRLSFEITENLNAIAEYSYSGSDTVNWSAVYNRQGASAITVSRQNPFLPQATQQAMDAAGVTTFQMNRLFYDMVNEPGSHIGQAGYSRRQDRFLAALEGKFLETGKWRAYYQRGHSDVWYTRDNNLIPTRFNQAIDVIANPATGGLAGIAAGTPICRSTLTAPANGCVPMNIFGDGSLGKGAVAWVTGASEGLRTRQDLDFNQDVWSIDAQYEPFSTWAGPVSVSAGYEYRKESFSSTADATSLASLWNVGNYQAGTGKYNVNEFFGEVLVPLLKDVSFAKSLDFNGAVRRTDYSTSGKVTTWKAGLTWDVIDELRLRGTRSRDIRAPNLNDLYAPGSQFVNSYLDRTQPGSPQVNNRTISGGNPNLTPEIADTWTAGGIYSPRWAPGLTLSVDWYKIDIKDAITAVGAQTIIDQCLGYNRPQNAAACDSIVRANPNNLIDATIFTGGINAQKVAVEGIDYEASYRADLSQFGSLPGSISLRALVSQRLKDETELPGDVAPPTLGTTGSLKWKGLLTAGYNLGPSKTTLTARYLGPGKITNWATTSAQGLADNLNHVDAVWYFDLAENYDLDIDGHNVTLFGVVENLFNRDPEQIPGGYLSFGTNNPYDLLGRSFRVGARFKF
jgi:iron complex outermembrane receptor protein